MIMIVCVWNLPLLLEINVSQCLALSLTCSDNFFVLVLGKL